jgi:cell division protein ZipA
MEIGLKEWLIIGGILVIGLIIFDGWRRKRGQRDTLKINIDGSLSDTESSEGDHNPELPNGGARVKKQDETGNDYLGLSAKETDYTPEPIHSDQQAVEKSLSTFDEHITDAPATDPITAVDTARLHTEQDNDNDVAPISEPLNEQYAPEHAPESLAQPVPELVDLQPAPEVTADVELSPNDIELHQTSVIHPDIEHKADFDIADDKSSLTEEPAIENREFDIEPTDDDRRIEPSFSVDEPEVPVESSEVEPQTPEREWEPEQEKQEPEPFVAQSQEPLVEPHAFEEPELSEPRKVEPRPIHELDPLFDDIPDEPLERAELDDNARDEPPVTAAAPVLNELPEEIETPINEHVENDASLSGNDWVEDTPEQADPRGRVDLDQPITVLMRQVSENAAKRDQASKVSPKPPSVEEERIQHEMFDWHLDDDDSEDAVSLRDHASESLAPQPEPAAEKPKKKAKKKKAKEKPAPEEDIPEQDSLFHDPLVEEARTSHRARQHVPDPEDVLVITVVGNEQPLNGRTLLEVVVACGMRHGDMSLFHRFEDGLEKGAVQFSMANAVNPGTFDLETMSDMETKGVSFFMSMSEPKDPKTAFDCMLATAETVAKHLNGDLLDENHSVMRPQTKMHYRERIREFELHKRARQGRPDMV